MTCKIHWAINTALLSILVFQTFNCAGWRNEAIDATKYCIDLLEDRQ